jgi:N-acetylglucosamine malate deacetylase 1
MKILAVGAHPDDIEIFMYGFLLVCKKRKDEISLLIATDGSAGGDKSCTELIQTRKKETIKGLQKLGIPDFLNIKDGKMSWDNKHMDILDKYINKKSPDLVVTHGPEDYHADHRALSDSVSKIVDFKCPILFCDTLMGINFTPEIYIDISEVFKEKQNAILAHKSQNPKKFLRATKLMNSYRAGQCNAPEGFYAEAYRLYAKFPYIDIRSILPPSPKIKPFNIKSEDSLI